MPTQEELNAAQVELGIANDNYAALANKYNQFQNMFAAYRDASPEKQALAAPTLDKALRAFEELKLDMYAAEDRIQQAQSRVDNYNNLIANQARQQPTRQVKTYRQTPQGTVEEVIVPEVTETVVETNGSNPYLNLYNMYVNRVENGQDLGSYFDVMRLSPAQVKQGLLNAGLTNEQVRDYLGAWSSHLKNKMNSLSQTNTTINENTGPQGTQTLLIPGEGIVTMQDGEIINTQTEGNINTFGPTPSGSSRGRTYTYSMTPIKDFVNSVNTFPNKAKGTMEMISATPQAISALGNTAQAYNQMTTYNGLQQLGNNIQGGVNLVKSVPGIIKAGDRIYNAYNTYRGQ